MVEILLAGMVLGIGKLVVSAHDGIENSKAREQVFTLPNGVKYYIDSQGKSRLCLNNKIIFRTQNGNFETVNHKEIFNKLEWENSQISKRNNNLIIPKHNERFYGNTWGAYEIDSGRYIAKIEKVTDYQGREVLDYKKYYWYDLLADLHKDLKYLNKSNPTNIKYGDEGVSISKEEYELIKRECCEAEKNNIYITMLR